MSTPPDFTAGKGVPPPSTADEERQAGVRSVSSVSPETPSFSAVAMMTAGPTLRQDTLDAKALSSIGKPQFGLTGRYGPKESLSETIKFGVKEEWSGCSKPSVWAVKGEDLEMVPWEFPLERTHREIRADAALVSLRVADVLRALSVETEYCSEKAKAKCKTTDYVCFRIRLFAGGDDGQPVVVEVQRRSGSPSSFMRTCRAILDAAEGKDLQAAKASVKRSRITTQPIGSMKCLASVIANKDNSETEATSALDGVLEMLRSERRDSSILGLENLCLLTDPVKTNPGVALCVSKRLILGDEKYDIREEVRLLTERDVFTPDYDAGSFSSNHADHLRHLALCALSNSLGVCAKDGCLAGALKSRWFADSLIPSLIDELGRADTNANNAYQAASCLLHMISSSSNLRKELGGNGSARAIEKAHEVGKSCHELLANETHRCLEAIHDMM